MALAACPGAGRAVLGPGVDRFLSAGPGLTARALLNRSAAPHPACGVYLDITWITRCEDRDRSTAAHARSAFVVADLLIEG